MPIETKPTIVPSWYAVALQEAGVTEIRGQADNKRILEYLACCPVAPGEPDHDEIPWCAAFVGWCLKKANYPYTRKRNARSYLDYGVPLQAPRFGCLVIFSADARGPASGHVAFYAESKPPAPPPPPITPGLAPRLVPPPMHKVYGGNQGNMVRVAPYPVSRVLGYRWPPGARL